MSRRIFLATLAMFFLVSGNPILSFAVDEAIPPQATVHDFGNGAVPAHRHQNPNGSLGGWVADTAFVASTAYLGPDAVVYNTAAVHDTAQVSGAARVYGNAGVLNAAQVSGAAWVYEDAAVHGTARVVDAARIYGGARVYGDAWVSGNARVYDGALVHGDTIVSNRAEVFEHAHVSGDAYIGDDALVFGHAWVYGAAYVYGNARVGYTPLVIFSETFTVTVTDNLVCIYRPGKAYAYTIADFTTLSVESLQETGFGEQFLDMKNDIISLATKHQKRVKEVEGVE